VGDASNKTTLISGEDFSAAVRAAASPETPPPMTQMDASSTACSRVLVDLLMGRVFRRMPPMRVLPTVKARMEGRKAVNSNILFMVSRLWVVDRG
jgi:hypothetical protein